jgi:serine protease Do
MRTGLLIATACLAGLLPAQDAPNPPEENMRANEQAFEKMKQSLLAAQDRVRNVQERVRVLDLLGSSSSYLGIGVADVDADRAKALKLADVHGVEIRNVADDGPAAKAGLKEGDVVLEYNGERVEGKEQLIRMVRETPVGRQVKLQVWRNGAAQNITVTVGKRSGNIFLSPDGSGGPWSGPEIRIPPMPDMPHPMMSWRNAVLGVECESLTSQLAQYFGVKEGVLVRSVVAGTAAEKAGIKAGDVIVKVNGTNVTTPREISSILRDRRGATRTVPVVVMRDQKEMTITVTLEAESQSPARGVRS